MHTYTENQTKLRWLHKFWQREKQKKSITGIQNKLFWGLCVGNNERLLPDLWGGQIAMGHFTHCKSTSLVS